MAIKQLYLSGFSHHLCGSAPRRTAAILKHAAHDLGGISRLAGRFFPAKLLTASGKNRNRHFPVFVTFWAFFSQVLVRNASCRAALASVQAWCAAQGKTVPGEGTSAYCQARKRLPTNVLRSVFDALGAWIDARCPDGEPLLKGRVVRVIDGTGMSMPDTLANRKKWPCAGNQKLGCGFPVAHLAGLFCLHTGRLIRFAVGSWKEREARLSRRLVAWVREGEVLLADRGFCGWGFMALLQRKGVDLLFRLHQARGDKPGVSVWKKPQRPESWGKCLWRELPGQLTLRILAFNVNVKGFRTRHVKLCTTLLETKTYPDEVLIALYMRRWKIELFFRDIKVTLGLDVLRCQSPELVEKEVWMQAIAYNSVRALMLEAALRHGVEIERLSFKGSVDMMRIWAGWFNNTPIRGHKRLLGELLLVLASDQVPERAFRTEPRAVKRRPKNYQFLTKPRHEMVISDKRRLKK